MWRGEGGGRHILGLQNDLMHISGVNQCFKAVNTSGKLDNSRTCSNGEVVLRIW